MLHKFFTLLIISCNFCLAQKAIPQFDLHKKVSHFIELEEKLGSTLYDTETEYIGLGDKAQPVIFRRKEKDIPDVLVYYYFSKKDSVVSEILYEWDVYNFDKSGDNKMPLDFSKKLITKYLDLYKSIAKKYGEASTEGNLDDLTKINLQEGLNRKDIWKANDSLKITMYTAISDFYEKKGGVTINPTHRIRLYVKHTSRDAGFSDGKRQEQTIIATKNYNTFISRLSNDDFENAKNLISEKALSNITPDILKEIKSTLVNNRQTEIYMSGMQIMQDGNTYLMIQYKYADDSASPPSEIIKVIFDADNKILTVQPMKKN